MPPPDIGHIGAAAGHDEIRGMHSLDRRPRPTHRPTAGPAGEIRCCYLPGVLVDQTRPSRKAADQWRVGDCPDGDGSRTVKRKAPEVMSNHHDFRIWPLRPQTCHARLEHSYVAEIQQVISGLVNKNPHG